MSEKLLPINVTYAPPGIDPGQSIWEPNGMGEWRGRIVRENGVQEWCGRIV